MPFLIAPYAIALYSTVHVIMTLSGLGDLLLRLHKSPALALPVDLLLAAIDAVCRSEGVVNVGLAQVQRHPNPVVAHSLLVQLVAGALISGGLPLLIATFQLHSPHGHWQLQTPAWLRRVDLLLFLPDLWGGVAVAFVHIVLRGGNIEARFPWLPPAAPVLAQWLSYPSHVNVHKVKNAQYLSLRETKAVGAAVLFVFLAVPVLYRHLSLRAIQPVTMTQTPTKKKSTRSKKKLP